MKRTATILVLAVAAVLGIVWGSLSVMHRGYSIETLQARRATLIQANKELEIEVNQLSALDRIERIATRELGMIMPRGNQIIFVHTAAGAFVHTGAGSSRQGPPSRR